ncbi:Hint domain-containing protein [Roseicyclus marinus]|uniref:Hint domain-containing protein n=1 Tax=Roseicyclus marinus TaxID=2161673 RepID=UPI00240FBBB2|nr:Hint domain-containing protein [Roseicyclus marinus]MDG3042401.1 Hint domain-containing protein [Roseicyclus marinus]
MPRVALYAYLPSDFGTTLPPDPHLAAQTGRQLTVSLSRHAVPVSLELDGGRLAAPARIDGIELALGDTATPLWTLVDTAKNVRLVGYRIDAEGGAVTAIATSLPLRAGRDYLLSLPVTGEGGDAAFHGGFVSGTRIMTAQGKRPVETLSHGDLVWTGADKFEPIVRIEIRTVVARGVAAPIRFRRGFWGLSEDLLISGNHALRAELQGEAVLVPASALTELGHGRAEFGASVTWHQILLPRHSLILAQGLSCESWWRAEAVGSREVDMTPILPRLTEAEAIARLR